MSLLVINAGSSTVKFCLFESATLRPLADGAVDWKKDRSQANVTFNREEQPALTRPAVVADYHAAVALALELLAPIIQIDSITACGQRIVHGGQLLRESTRIDDKVKKALTDLTELAPLHNPPALEGIAAAEAALPGIPQVAVFDTSFFQTLKPERYLYPVPQAWYSDWGIRRFGFHGISHAYCAGRAAEMLPGRPDVRLITCHLGNGCSASAIRGQVAVDTTMGLTPLEGLMMGTRSGSIDPSILLYLLRTGRLGREGLDQALNHQSGLLGTSGVSSDFRQVEKAARAGQDQARLALTMYANRIRSAIASLAATLGGVDALLFTAGVGENSASLRAEVCQGLEYMGIKLDPERNQHCRPDADIALTDSPIRILIVHTREELLIAQETKRLTGT